VKRGCLIALIALPVIVIAIAGTVYYRASQSLGLSPAERIDAETLATPETRVRAVVDLEKVIPFVKGLLPATGLPLPWYASSFIGDPIADLVPYQIALQGGAGYKENAYHWTFFVNEKVLGPAVVTFARTRFDEFKQQFAANKGAPEAQLFNTIQWQDGFIQNEPRGSLVVRAALPLPAGMQNRVLNSWNVDKGASKQVIAGDNLVEVAIDNASGDLYTLIATLGKANGQSLDQVYAMPQVEQLIKAIDNVRATANLTGDDQIDIVVKTRLNTADFMVRTPFLIMATTLIDGSSALESLMSMGQKQVTPEQAQFQGLKRMFEQWGMKADYKNGEKPVFDGDTLIATYEISGFRPLLQQQVDTMVQQLASLQ
jgi:hypothetical protein